MKKVLASHAELAAKRETEIWLYSYADLITNLMAFFIVLLVVSKSDQMTGQKIKDSIAKAVGQKSGLGISQNDELINAVAQLIKDNKLGENIAVEKRADGLSLTFSGGVFFETTSAGLTIEARSVLDKVLPIFLKVNTQHRIDVEGHADTRPVKDNEIFPSNWELSAARAGSVVRYLASQGVKPGQMRAIGYSDTQPVSGEMQKNRRVVISIGKGLK